MASRTCVEQLADAISYADSLARAEPMFEPFFGKTKLFILTKTIHHVRLQKIKTIQIRAMGGEGKCG